METVTSKAYEDRLEKLLKSDRFFSQLSDKIVQELVARAEFVVYSPGEIIINAGDKADAFYILLEGDARVFDRSQAKDPERLNYLRPGDLMGELGLLNNRPRSASIHALGETTVARFDRDTWEWLIASVPHLSQELEQRFQGYTQYIKAPYPNAQAEPEARPDELSNSPEDDPTPPHADETQRRLDITIRALSDAPTVHDLLGFTVYADALVKFIEDPQTEKPLTIAIDAPWGMGKSSLMRMIEQRLAGTGSGEDGDQGTGQGKRKNKQRQQQTFPTVWFNAWQYDQSEAIWANLVLEILKQVRGRMNFWQRLGLTISLTWRRFDREMLVQNIVRYLLIYTLPILLIGLTLVGLAVFFLAPAESGVLEQTRLYLAAVGWSAFISLIFAVGKEAYDKLTQPLSLKLEEYIRQPDYQDKAGFLTQFRDDFRRVVNVITKTNRCRWPLVIFIDDLDRCEPPKPVDIIEAINLLLDSKHCVFIIGMDSRTVAGSIEAKYKNMLAYLEQTGPSGSLTFGQQFLEKIVQVRFRIPKTTRDKFKLFIDKHLALDADGSLPGEADEANEPEVRQAVALLKAAQREQTQPLDKAAEVVKKEIGLTSKAVDTAQTRIKSDEALFDNNKAVQETISAAASYFGYNPRQVKRFINLYRLQTYIAQERKLLKNPGFQLDTLGKLLILNMAWPRVATALRRDRTFIDRLEAAIEHRMILNKPDLSHEDYSTKKARFERYIEDKLIAASIDDSHLYGLLSELKEKLEQTKDIREYLDLTEISLDPEAELAPKR